MCGIAGIVHADPGYPVDRDLLRRMTPGMAHPGPNAGGEELGAPRHRFRTRSDTEVIVHAYEEFGPGCVARLRGMFAFALWDERRRLLLLARDRAGKKPLYYVVDGDRLPPP